MARDPALDARFRREIAIHARLGGHPHIAVVRTAGEHEGRPYLVLDHVVGVDLRKLVADRGPLPYREACGYAVQAARGLGHAHERGVVHRDVKPANLVLSHEDRAVRVIDWGLARDGGRDGRGDEDLTRSGVALGTFSYAAPEQLIDPAAASPRSDLYSLGCTLHELLTGRPPFAGRPDLILAHARDPVPPLPPELGVPGRGGRCHSQAPGQAPRGPLRLGRRVHRRRRPGGARDRCALCHPPARLESGRLGPGHRGHPPLDVTTPPCPEPTQDPTGHRDSPGAVRPSASSASRSISSRSLPRGLTGEPLSGRIGDAVLFDPRKGTTCG